VKERHIAYRKRSKELSAIKALEDSAALAEIVRSAAEPEHQIAALRNPRFTDERLALDLANRGDVELDVRRAALQRIRDSALLAEIEAIPSAEESAGTARESELRELLSCLPVTPPEEPWNQRSEELALAWLDDAVSFLLTFAPDEISIRGGKVVGYRSSGTIKADEWHCQVKRAAPNVWRVWSWFRYGD
jgi:hypothetical protein